MSSWKQAGLTYLQYITICTSTLRNSVKPQLQPKVWPREDVSFRKQVWDRVNGKPGEKCMYITVYILLHECALVWWKAPKHGGR